MKIAFLIGTLNMGGAEKQLVYTANALSKMGNEVYVYTLRTEARLQPLLEEKVVLVKGNFKSFLSLTALLILSKQLSSIAPDVIHCHLYNANMIGRIIKHRLKNTILINHIHGLGSNYSKLRIQLDKWTKSRCDHFLFVSDNSRFIRLNRELYPKDKTSVIYNSVDFEQFPLSPKTQKKGHVVFGIAARLIKLKRIQDCIHLVRNLKNHKIDSRLNIAGVGPELDYLQKEANEHHVDAQVKFFGFISNMKEFYNSIDVLLLSSETEDLPLSIIEALAAGKPIIATNVGGVSEMLMGTCSLLTTSFDSSEFITNVKHFLNNLNYDACAVQNREVARQRFDIVNNTLKLQSLYFHLLENKSVV